MRLPFHSPPPRAGRATMCRVRTLSDHMLPQAEVWPLTDSILLAQERPSNRKSSFLLSSLPHTLTQDLDPRQRRPGLPPQDGGEEAWNLRQARSQDIGHSLMMNHRPRGGRRIGKMMIQSWQHQSITWIPFGYHSLGGGLEQLLRAMTRHRTRQYLTSSCSLSTTVPFFNYELYKLLAVSRKRVFLLAKI
jgi:hypothetical protein